MLDWLHSWVVEVIAIARVASPESIFQKITIGQKSDLGDVWAPSTTLTCLSSIPSKKQLKLVLQQQHRGSLFMHCSIGCPGSNRQLQLCIGRLPQVDSKSNCGFSTFHGATLRLSQRVSTLPSCQDILCLLKNMTPNMLGKSTTGGSRSRSAVSRKGRDASDACQFFTCCCCCFPGSSSDSSLRTQFGIVWLKT